MTDEQAAVDRVLTIFKSAALADGELYFSLFADDAVFMDGCL